MVAGPTSSPASRQRIDKWLFFTRVVKSRSLAQTHVHDGHIRINDERIDQPSRTVQPGDKVEVKLQRRTLLLLVRLPGERRGPYEEAKLLYEDVTPDDSNGPLTALERAQRAPGTGRPTKRDRRMIDRLMDGDD